MSEETVIDLSSVPLKPVGKREIAQLEMALIIGTLYRPVVLELVRDPVERSTWIDSLAVAAAAFARYKAGMTTAQIAEELGRSEVTIRSHLNQKTKAGRLVAETLEKMRKGELKITVPFLKATGIEPIEELKSLRLEVERLKQERTALESKLKETEESLNRKISELENAKVEINTYKNKIEELTSSLTQLSMEKQELENKISKTIEIAERIREAISKILQELNQAM